MQVDDDAKILAAWKQMKTQIQLPQPNANPK